jgi:hypothetical protein
MWPLHPVQKECVKSGVATQGSKHRDYINMKTQNAIVQNVFAVAVPHRAIRSA